MANPDLPCLGCGKPIHTGWSMKSLARGWYCLICQTRIALARPNPMPRTPRKAGTR